MSVIVEERERELAERRAEDRAQNAAAKARSVVADQVQTLILEGQSTGSAQQVAVRFAALVDETRSGDPLLARAAAMELSRAAALYAVRLDLRQGAATF